LERKRILARAAEGADPVGGQILKGGSRFDPAGVIAQGGIVYVSTEIAYILLHTLLLHYFKWPFITLWHFAVFFKGPVSYFTFGFFCDILDGNE
jgi:hypothetical protein